MYTEN